MALEIIQIINCDSITVLKLSFVQDFYIICYHNQLDHGSLPLNWRHELPPMFKHTREHNVVARLARLGNFILENHANRSRDQPWLKSLK